MTLPDGWLRVRRWRMPLSYFFLRQGPKAKKGACGALKQPFVAATTFDWFAEIPETETGAAPESDLTRPYLLDRYRFTDFDQSLLLEQTGSPERLLETIDWVEEAHKRLKMFVLQKSDAEPTVQMLQDAHEPAVRRLAKILEQTLEPPLAARLIRAHLDRQVPGVIFPEVAEQRAAEELVAAAWNINAWLAQYGTFACGSRVVII